MATSYILYMYNCIVNSVTHLRWVRKREMTFLALQSVHFSACMSLDVWKDCSCFHLYLLKMLALVLTHHHNWT